VKSKEVGIRLSVKDKEVVERALKDIGREGQDALRAIERSGRPASHALRAVNDGAANARKTLTGLNGVARLVRTSLVGIGVGLASGLSVGAIRDVARSVAEIGDAARRAGLDVKSFQELKYVAEQNRLGVDSLTDGMKELQLRADQFIATGGGSAAEAFQRLGYSADELKAKLKDPSELFTEIIGKLGELDRAAAIRIADEIFGGTGGERFVQLIEQGADGIRQTIDEAHRLGAVMSEEMIDRADELDRKFQAVATTVGTALHRAILEAAGALYDFMERFESFDQQSKAGLDARLKEAGRNRVRLENQILQNQSKLRTGNLGVLDTREGLELGIRRAQDGLAQLAEMERQILDELNSRPDPIDITVPGGGGGGITPPDKKAIAAADREREKIEGVIRALRDELAAIGATEEEKRLLNELRRAGVEAASAEGQTIKGLVEQIAAEETALKQVEDVLDNVGDTARDVFGGIVSDIRAGKDATEAWDNALGKVLDKMFSTGLDTGIGAFTELLAGAFRPGAGATGGTFGNGLWGSAIFGQAHSGWQVGRGAAPQSRRLSAASTASLPRRHMGGLNADEQLVVARRDEGIFTPRQMDNADGLIAALMRNLEHSRSDGGGRPLRVELVNRNGEGKQVEEATMRQEGGVDIARLIIGTVNGAAAEGKLGTVEQVYGLRRRGL
jgi:hypothetical protein